MISPGRLIAAALTVVLCAQAAPADETAAPPVQPADRVAPAAGSDTSGAVAVAGSAFPDDSVPESGGDVLAVWQAYRMRWEATEDYAASFKQKIEVEGVGSEVSSGGRFSYVRPDKVRWDYMEGPPQTVVGDGHWLWVYQPDLEQVYRVDYQSAFGSGGLMELLTGRESLMERYEIAIEERTSDSVRIRLTPHDEVAGTIHLAVKADTFELESVVVADPAGSITRMEFFTAERNRGLDAAQFTFTPPDGVDIITRP